jgi:hypothetical protein
MTFLATNLDRKIFNGDRRCTYFLKLNSQDRYQLLTFSHAHTKTRTYERRIFKHHILSSHTTTTTTTTTTTIAAASTQFRKVTH